MTSPHDILLFLLSMIGGIGLRHFWPAALIPNAVRPSYPFSPLPIVSAGQSVTVIFTKDDVEQSHRRVESEDLLPTMTCPKGGPPQEEYAYSHLDGRGRFIFTFTRSVKDT